MGKAINLQDMFLNQVRKESIPVILYLTSGVQLRGQVKGFDAFTVILELALAQRLLEHRRLGLLHLEE